MRDNPAHTYRKVSKKIASKLKETLLDCLDAGRTPDLYWNLEQAIVDAMRLADTMGCERTQLQFNETLKDFEDNDGTSHN